MIRELRRSFILTSMALVSVVLVAVLTVQTVTAWQQAQGEIGRVQRQTVEMLKSGQEMEVRLGPPLWGGPFEGKQPPEEGRSRLAYFRLPAFAVEVDDQGQVISLHSGPGVEVSTESAQEMTDLALRSASLSQYHLSCLQLTENGRRFLAFADTTAVTENFRRQVLTSLLILTGALLAFYFISRFLAYRAVEPVERAWEQQRQFVADASHELKTPITVILANSDIIKGHPGETVESQEKWLGYIREEAQRMKGLVEDLLFLAKSDAAQLTTQQAPVDLNQVVIGALLPFESVAFESGVTLTDHLTPDITVLGDQSQLRRLVVILLDNAVKYAGRDGQVTVILERLGEQPRLIVHNSGPAIPAQHLPHLFERFYRADAARDRKQGGHGLGLAIAHSIVQRHGGTITVTSGQDVGTTFTVLFPKSGKKGR